MEAPSDTPKAYSRLYYTELKAVALAHWDNPIELRAIIDALKTRRKKKAQLLRLYIEERIAALAKQSFKWPSTAIVSAGQAFSQIHFHYTDGLLKFMGYTVGHSGLPRSKRLAILDFVYNESVPQVQSRSYMSEWALPKSSSRLRKLAYSLAAFCRNALRRHDAGLADMSVACEEWNDDLEYLRHTYYVGRYDFEWPKT